MQADPRSPDWRRRTFRDPAGWVEVQSGAAFRVLQPAFAEDLLEFLATPFHDELVRDGQLIASEILSPEKAAAALGEVLTKGYQVLRHPRVSFISYPWEWSPAQWLAAAELTLTLNRALISKGWILKDATPLNILFRGVRPVLVDVASVARLHPTEPIWYAYSQFVRTFLLPMMAHTLLGWPLRAAQLRRDGLEPEELLPVLPLAQRFRQPALSAVTLPSVLGKARANRAASGTGNLPSARDPEFVEHVLQGTCTKLLKQMRRAMPKERNSAWSSYVGTATHYSEADHAAKRAFVFDALQSASPKRVLDIGANAGVYSDLAAESGAEVVAIDTDLQTVDRLCHRLRDSDKNILPLVLDLANPSPGVGWRNRESASFLERAVGHFEGVLMLAVLHHLLLHDHIPLASVAALASTLTTRLLVIEWVPPTDSMFRELVRGREAVFGSLTEAAFRKQFAVYFRTLREHTLDNGRVLFHFERLGMENAAR